MLTWTRALGAGCVRFKRATRERMQMELELLLASKLMA
jgi:hypothetical protein